jgi:hypothetical protein
MGSQVTRDEILNYHIAANEFLNRVIMPEGCERAGKPIHSETVIFDCTNMGLHRKDASFFFNFLFSLILLFFRIPYECLLSVKGSGGCRSALLPRDSS